MGWWDHARLPWTTSTGTGTSWGHTATSCTRVIITCVGLMPSDGQSKHGQRVCSATRVPLLPAGFRSLVIFGIRLTCFSENTSYPVGQSKLLPLGENPFSYKRLTPEKVSLETSCSVCALFFPCVQSREWGEGTTLKTAKQQCNSPTVCAVFNNLMCGSGNEHRLPRSRFGFCPVAKKQEGFCIFVPNGKLVIAFP